jgi:serine/threonine-protein kinase
MGEVWKATHRLLARPAAVKLIGPDVLGDADQALVASLFQRFEREAQATAALSSPHTIGVYDFGIAQDGTFYYVMELLDGLDVHTLVSRHGPQPAERVVHILRQACHSLAEAHARGVVHRDIKPANIFICRYGLDVDFVKVLDFGLVGEIQRASAPDTHLTHPDAIVGTPAFLAPEAITGETPVDGRSDLYGLGCVAYWMLTGRDVFVKPNAMTLLAAHLKDRPDPVGRHAAVPRDLEAAVMSCLEKDPARRPQTGTELSQRLAETRLETEWTAARATEWWNTYHPPVQEFVQSPGIPHDAS